MAQPREKIRSLDQVMSGSLDDNLTVTEGTGMKDVTSWRKSLRKVEEKILQEANGLTAVGYVLSMKNCREDGITLNSRNNGGTALALLSQANRDISKFKIKPTSDNPPATADLVEEDAEADEEEEENDDEDDDDNDSPYPTTDHITGVVFEPRSSGDNSKLEVANSATAGKFPAPPEAAPRLEIAKDSVVTPPPKSASSSTAHTSASASPWDIVGPEKQMSGGIRKAVGSVALWEPLQVNSESVAKEPVRKTSDKLSDETLHDSSAAAPAAMAISASHSIARNPPNAQRSGGMERLDSTVVARHDGITHQPNQVAQDVPPWNDAASLPANHFNMASNGSSQPSRAATDGMVYVNKHATEVSGNGADKQLRIQVPGRPAPEISGSGHNQHTMQRSESYSNYSQGGSSAGAGPMSQQLYTSVPSMTPAAGWGNGGDMTSSRAWISSPAVTDPMLLAQQYGNTGYHRSSSGMSISDQFSGHSGNSSVSLINRNFSTETDSTPPHRRSVSFVNPNPSVVTPPDGSMAVNRQHYTQYPPQQPSPPQQQQQPQYHQEQQPPPQQQQQPQYHQAQQQAYYAQQHQQQYRQQLQQSYAQQSQRQAQEQYQQPNPVVQSDMRTNSFGNFDSLQQIPLEQHQQHVQRRQQQPYYTPQQQQQQQQQYQQSYAQWPQQHMQQQQQQQYHQQNPAFQSSGNFDALQRSASSEAKQVPN